VEESFSLGMVLAARCHLDLTSISWCVFVNNASNSSDRRRLTAGDGFLAACPDKEMTQMDVDRHVERINALFAQSDHYFLSKPNQCGMIPNKPFSAEQFVAALPHLSALYEAGRSILGPAKQGCAVEIFSYFGLIYNHQNKPQMSLPWNRIAAAVSPTCAKIRFQLGTDLLRLGRLRASLNFRSSDAETREYIEEALLEFGESQRHNPNLYPNPNSNT